VFDNPDEPDSDRKMTRHLAFGYGVHQCLGQNIAAGLPVHRYEFPNLRALNFAIIGFLGSGRVSTHPAHRHHRQAGVVVDFLESPEHHDLRDAIGAVTDKYGPAYFAEHASAHEPTTELWQELAEHGFIGINLLEEYGGGGAGMTELAMVCEETAAHGCPLLLPLVPSAISGELLTRYGSDE
jgi:hypothetical protein